MLLPPFAPLAVRTTRLAALGLLAAGLSACGGGGEAPPTVTVQWVAPAANDVLTGGAALPVSARVLVNNAAATDGTTVQFSQGTASATGKTSAGVASAGLGSTATGKVTLQASATVSGQTGTDTRSVYVRPAAAPLELLVPAYFYPSGAGASAWNALTAGTAATPGVRVTAILNPSNGVFTQADAAIVNAATAFTAAGGQLLGYVYTRYGTGERSLAALKANIDNYLNRYGRGLVSGIFLDEMAATADRVAFYQELYAYIKAKDPSLRVVGNPGTVPVAGYAGVADALAVFEGKASTFASYDPRTPAREWVYTQPNGSLAALVHNAATCSAMQGALQSAASARTHTGLFYATDREYEPATGVGNPWAGLPSYWTALLQSVERVNAGQALTAC